MIMKTVTDTEKKMPAVEGGRQGEDAVGSAIFTPIIVDPSVSCQAKRHCFYDGWNCIHWRKRLL